ncbi:hypothetical protein GCM10010273_51070 [Streptomyces lavendulocolor]
MRDSPFGARPCGRRTAPVAAARGGATPADPAGHGLAVPGAPEHPARHGPGVVRGPAKRPDPTAGPRHGPAQPDGPGARRNRGGAPLGGQRLSGPTTCRAMTIRWIWLVPSTI